MEEIWRYLKISQNTEIYSKIEDYIWSKVLYRQTDFYGDGGYCNRFDESQTVEAELEQHRSTISNQEATIEYEREVNKKKELEIDGQQKLIEAMKEKQKEINELEIVRQRKLKKQKEVVYKKVFKIIGNAQPPGTLFN